MGQIVAAMVSCHAPRYGGVPGTGKMAFEIVPLLKLRMMSMAADKAGVPREGGTERVTVSIRGAIFLR